MKKVLALVLAMMMVLCLCACGAEEEAAPAAEEAAPAVEAAPEAAPAAEPAGDASGEMEASGEPGGMGNQSTDFEVEVDGVAGTAHYEDVDNNDQTTKSFVITFDGKTVNGFIDKGVWTAESGDAADQAIVDAVHTAFEGNNAASGEPSNG